MSTNYESARWALAICLEAFPSSDDYPLDMLLPRDTRQEVCTPEHLTSVMGLAGLDATLVESRAVGAVIHDALRHRWIGVCCVGLFPHEARQRWLVGFGREGKLVEFVGARLGEPLFSPEPAHFKPLVIVVRGRAGRISTTWPDPN